MLAVKNTLSWLTAPTAATADGRHQQAKGRQACGCRCGTGRRPPRVMSPKASATRKVSPSLSTKSRCPERTGGAGHVSSLAVAGSGVFTAVLDSRLGRDAFAHRPACPARDLPVELGIAGGHGLGREALLEGRADRVARSGAPRPPPPPPPGRGRRRPSRSRRHR